MKLVSEITENKPFNQHLDTRVVCGASNFRLGAALEQNPGTGWVPIAYASKFPNSLEEKYSMNEFELLGFVWAINHFKNYFYEKNFTVITANQALMNALNASERPKTSQGRLTRLIDRLIPFTFDIKHIGGTKMWLINNTFTNSVGLALTPSDYNQEFVVASNNSSIANIILIDNVILNNLASQNRAPHRLIKKRAESKRNATTQLLSHVKARQTFRAKHKRSFKSERKQSLDQLHSSKGADKFIK